MATLRHGCKCYGRTLHAAYFKAVHELNPELEARFVHLQIEERRDDQGRKVKTETMIFARYHQLQAVRTLVDAARREGVGHNYLGAQGRDHRNAAKAPNRPTAPCLRLGWAQWRSVWFFDEDECSPLHNGRAGANEGDVDIFDLALTSTF